MPDPTDDQVKAVRATMLERGLTSPAPFGLVLDAEEDGRPDLPRVQLPLDGWQLSRFSKEVGSVLQGRGVFRWKDGIVTISEETGERELMDSHRFRSFVERYMQTFRLFFSQKAGTIEIPQTMAVEHAQGCLRSDEFTRRQPRLVRIHSVRLPILRDDGRVELLPVGYDAESGIYTLPMGFDYDEAMTLEEGAFIMKDLHREFPFADKKSDGTSRSESVHMSNFLSQFGYMLLPRESRRLNFLYNANAPRSGKTLLVELILNTVHGRAAIDNMPDDRNKLRDRLDTAVLSGATHLVFDDLEGFLRNGLLNSFLTAPTWSGRKFHTQDEFIAEKSPVVMLTGNNVEMTPDVAGRTLTCDLYREEADDQAQRIEKPIDGDYVKSKGVRAQLLSALWAIVRAWRDGRPHTPSRVISGYQRWSAVFAPMVSIAGFGDPPRLE